MKNFFKVIFILLYFWVSFFPNIIFADENNIFKISIEKVPSSFYGTWRVSSQLLESNSYDSFKKKSLDLWNLSSENNVIQLSNPFSGAKAEIIINSCENSTLEFVKSGRYENNDLTDIVKITLKGESFTGYNIIKLKQKDGHFKYAKYLLNGEKIAGMSILGD